MKYFHYVYKITNLITNKEYIGVHSTKNLNDCYMGSSKSLKEDIIKYGLCNFKKEILELFETKELALKKEKELVNKEYVGRDDTYNLILGGNCIKYGYNTVMAKDSDGNKLIIKKSDERWKNGSVVGINKGKTLSNVQKQKMSIQSSNSVWINNGEEEKFVQKKNLTNYLNNGWSLNRLPMLNETKQKMRDAVIDTVWINKDGKNVRIKSNMIDEYLSQGWQKGRTYHKRKFSDETKQKISESNKGKKMSEETKIKISKSTKNSKWMNKDGKSAFVKKSEIEKYILDGWVFGDIRNWRNIKK